MTPPTTPEFQALVQAMKNRIQPGRTNRAAFALTALYLQRYEGIEPGITITLHDHDFNFQDRWVEFRPFHRSDVVRRRLSDESAAHVRSHLATHSAPPGDRLHHWAPTPRRQGKPGKQVPPLKRYSVYNVAVGCEVKAAGFDPEQFKPVVLKWAWVDQHPNLREQEVRTNILAKCILRWAKLAEQEGLFRLLFNGNAVLRPGWAYPQYDTGAPSRSPVPSASGANPAPEPAA